MAGLIKFPLTVLISILLMYAILAILIKSQLKRSIVPLLIFQIASLSLIFYAVWPLTPPGKKGRQVTADNFLTALSTGDSEQALDLIPRYTPMSDIEKELFISNIINPNNFPISWSIYSINQRDIVVAKIELADGIKDEIILYLNWDWGKARWGVSSVSFHESERLRFFGLIGFSNRFPYIPYSLFGSITLVLGIIALLKSRSTLTQLNSMIA